MGDFKTLVIGGGLMGVTTAWELISRGEPVELLEAAPDLALETSYANGAMLTPAMSDPWNGPGVYWQLAASLFNPYAPMKLRISAVPSLIGWGIDFLRNSSAARHRVATRASYVLAAYSLAETIKLREALGLEYDAASRGAMKVFRSAAALAGPKRIAEDLAGLGLRYEVLDADGAVAVEPQLASIRHSIAAALYFPDDATGDAHLFCRALADRIRQHGGSIHCGVRVKRLLLSQGGRIVGVETDAGRLEAQRVVLAAGNGSASLARTVGVRVPIRPAKGYSVTIPRQQNVEWPRLPVIDDMMHAVVVPLGDRLRLVGTAEFAGHDKSIRQSRIDNLFRLLQNVYPHIAASIDRSTAQPWAGLRPMSSNGLPCIGPVGPQGLFLNAGHGHLGWTHSVGSARLLVDQMLGVTPAIDPAPYRPA
jgi:D-amino-acid dehydrogenase